MLEPITYLASGFIIFVVYQNVNGNMSDDEMAILLFLNIIVYAVIRDDSNNPIESLPMEVITLVVTALAGSLLAYTFLYVVWTLYVQDRVSKAFQYRGLEVTDWSVPESDGRTEFEETEQMFRKRVFSQVNEYDKNDVISQQGKRIVVENDRHGRKLIEEKE
jgi:hypothetical protein